MSQVVVSSSDPVVVTVRTEQPRVEVVQEVREVVRLPPAVPEVVTRGIPGPRGADGAGDNETFNDNLALLYAVAKS